MKPADKGPGGAAPRRGGGEERQCPLCGKPMARAYRPFCSKRCSDIDLGRWLGGRYAIPGESTIGGKDEAGTEEG